MCRYFDQTTFYPAGAVNSMEQPWQASSVDEEAWTAAAFGLQVCNSFTAAAPAGCGFAKASKNFECYGGGSAWFAYVKVSARSVQRVPAPHPPQPSQLLSLSRQPALLPPG